MSAQSDPTTSPAVPAAPTEGPAPHAKEASTRYKTALIAVIAASVTAVAALGAAYITSTVSSDTARDVAQANFLHTERRTAYADFLNHWIDLNGSQTAAEDAITGGSFFDLSRPAPDTATIQAAIDDWNKKHSIWGNDLTTLQLIGSNEVLKVLEDTPDLEAKIVTYFYHKLGDLKNGTSYANRVAYVEAVSMMHTDFDAFRDQAHSELTE